MFDKSTAENLARQARENREEYVVLHVTDQGVEVRGDDYGKEKTIHVFPRATAEDASEIVPIFQRARVAARLKTTKLVGCPICEWYHPSHFNGDCREDGSRFPTPDNDEDVAEQFDTGDPGLDLVEDGRTTPVIYVLDDDGEATDVLFFCHHSCRSSYLKEHPELPPHTGWHAESDVTDGCACWQCGEPLTPANST